METIHALEAWEGGGVDEVILVDNASSDGGVALVETRFPGVEIIRLPTNGGPSVARNVGMRAARNRWVFAIDNDALPQPDLLRKLAAALEDEPGAIIAQPRSVFESEQDRVHYDGALMHYVGIYSLRNFYRPLAEAEGQGVVEVDGLVAIAALLDRDEILHIGGYDETLFILFEDHDLSLRVRLSGRKILSVEDAIVLHKGGTPGVSFRSGSYPAKRAFYHARNRWIVLAKVYSLRDLMAALPGMLVYECAWLGFAFVKGHLRSHLWGKIDFFRVLPNALRERGRIRRIRRVPLGSLLVAGPHTPSPILLRKPFARWMAGALDRVLAAWWSIGRRLM